MLEYIRSVHSTEGNQMNIADSAWVSSKSNIIIDVLIT